MLKYFIAVTEALLIPGVLTGLLLAFVNVRYGQKGRRFPLAGIAAGVVAAIIMAVMKNTTSLVNTGNWNLRIFSLSLLSLLVWYIFSIPALEKKSGKGGATVRLTAAGVLAFTLLFYALPDVLAYPFTFSLGQESIFSTAYIYRFIGWLLGLALTALTVLGVYWGAKKAGSDTSAVILHLALLINGIQQIAKMTQTALSKRLIPNNPTLFQFAKFTSNHSDIFLYAVMLVALSIPVILVVRSFRASEPYENPAQHRKIRASWRSSRRWSGLIVFCFIMTVLCMTAFTAIDNRPVELSPIENSEIRGDNVYVSLEQVDDGHLHRFAYHTPNGKDVRFIVIKKPNSSAYGIGLDACDICGETGYYERDGQIVCKLCDVVMNINTIGFKGGCNPIVIDYSVENGYIIVPAYTLIEHENEFK